MSSPTQKSSIRRSISTCRTSSVIHLHTHVNTHYTDATQPPAHTHAHIPHTHTHTYTHAHITQTHAHTLHTTHTHITCNTQLLTSCTHYTYTCTHTTHIHTLCTFTHTWTLAEVGSPVRPELCTIIIPSLWGGGGRGDECGCVGGGGGKRSTAHVKRMWRGVENVREGMKGMFVDVWRV